MRTSKDDPIVTPGSADIHDVLIIRDATSDDIEEIESLISEYVKGHPAENHPRPGNALEDAYFGTNAFAHLLVAQRQGQIVGMGQWWPVFDMFWGMRGAEAEWLYVRPALRRSGIALAIIARICADARRAGAQFLHGAGEGKVAELYERVAVGRESREFHLSGEAFQQLADLEGLPPREIVRERPVRELSLQPADPGRHEQIRPTSEPGQTGD